MIYSLLHYEAPLFSYKQRGETSSKKLRHREYRLRERERQREMFNQSQIFIFYETQALCHAVLMAYINHNKVAFMVKLNAFLRHELLSVSEVSITCASLPQFPAHVREVYSPDRFHYTHDSPRLTLTQHVLNLISYNSQCTGQNFIYIENHIYCDTDGLKLAAETHRH